MSNGNLVIGLTGDIMIGRNVNDVMDHKGNGYMWGNLLPLLTGTDLNIVNLETTLTRSNRLVPKVFNFKATPDKVTSLSEAHVHIVNLANNHVLDFDTEGLLETISTLDAAGIKHTGAGMNSEQAGKPVVFTKNNVTIGVLGFTDNEPGWKAAIDKPGVNYIDISCKSDRDFALASIQSLKEKTALVIVSMHWGPNMKAYPAKHYIAFAHAMIEHGASIIHGHSAHNFQAIEVYNQKLILYDTGDFIDDYVVHPELKNDHSFFYRVEVQNDRIVSVNLTPVLISNCQVNLASGDDRLWSLQRVRELSAMFGTTVTDTGDVLLQAGIKRNALQ